MTYWFAAHGGPEGGPQITNRLTEDEVLALPEIVYKAPEDEDEQDDKNDTHNIHNIHNNDSDGHTEESQAVDTSSCDPSSLSGEEVDIVVGAGSDDAAGQETATPIVAGPAEEDPRPDQVGQPAGCCWLPRQHAHTCTGSWGRVVNFRPASWIKTIIEKEKEETSKQIPKINTIPNPTHKVMNVLKDAAVKTSARKEESEGRLGKTAKRKREEAQQQLQLNCNNCNENTRLQ
jgi:hypothetical protein